MRLGYGLMGNWVALSLILGTGGIGLPTIAGRGVAQTTPPTTERDSNRDRFHLGEQQLLQGKYKAAIQTFEQILAENKTDLAALDKLGEAYLSVGNHDRGLEILQGGLEQAKSQKNDRQAAAILSTLADGYRAKTDYDKVIELAQQAIALQTRLQDSVGLGKSYLILGATLVGKGEPDRASEVLQQGLTTLKADGKPVSQSLSQPGKGGGQTSQNVRQPEKSGAAAAREDAGARSSRQNATAFAEGEQTQVQRGSDVQRQTRDATAAISATERLRLNLDIMRQQGNPTVDLRAQSNKERKAQVLQGRLLTWLGRSQSLLKQPEQGLQTMQQALAMNRKTGDRTMEGTTLFFLGLTQIEQNKPELALDFYRQSLAVFETTDDRNSVGYLHNFIGNAHYQLKQYPEAQAQFQQALKMHQANDRPKADIAQVWANLGQAYKEQKQYPQARERYQQALALYRQLANAQQQSQMLSNLGYAFVFEGNIAREQGSFARAKAFSEQGLTQFQQQLAVAQKANDRDQELWALQAIAQAHGNIGMAVYSNGNYAEAVQFYQRSEPISQQAQTLAALLQKPDRRQQINKDVFTRRIGMINAYLGLERYTEALEQIRLMRQLLKDDPAAGSEQRVLFSEHTIYASLSLQHNAPEKYDQLLQYSQKAIAIAEQLQPPGRELRHWVRIAQVYQFRGQYDQALAVNQRVLARSREVKDRQQEIFALSNIGFIHSRQANHPQALDNYQQALQLGQRYPSKATLILNNMANVYVAQGTYSKAMLLFQERLAYNQTTAVQLARGVTPDNIRWLCQETDNFPSADPKDAPGALAQACAAPDRPLAGDILNTFHGIIGRWHKVLLGSVSTNLNNIGVAYEHQGNYPKAKDLYQQALAISRQQNERSGEATNLNNLGVVSINQGDYTAATQYVEQAFKLAIAQNDRNGEIVYRLNLGQVASRQGNYATALERYQTALTLSQSIGQRATSASILDKIADVQRYQGNYAKALENYQQALKMYREIGQPGDEVVVLLHLGALHRHLGDYPLAIATHQQALGTAQKIGIQPEVAGALLALAADYREQGNADAALRHYQQALALFQAIGNRYGESITQQGLGRLYLQQNQPAQAAAILQQALIAQREMGVRADVGGTLSFLGQAYTQLGKTNEAQLSLQEALVVAQENGDRPTQAVSLSFLGELFAQQKQPELAIAFYKQSVNVQEEIKGGLKSLARSQQESYANTVSGTYRALANLLLGQGRVLEAQQVLELLKIQEIREFTREAKTAQTEGIATTASEAKILKEYGSLIAFGQKVEACKQTRCPQLSQLNNQQQTLTQQYNQTVASFEKEIRQRKSIDDALLDPRNLSPKAKEIVEAQPGTVLIYPFVLEDKIWLLWAAKGGIVKSVPVPVSRQQLGETVVRFRNAVQSSSPRDRQAISTAGKQLYDWLIKPIEPELKANKIQNLVFSLDRVTRYIPISALFDGEKFLVENYTVSTVLSADLTDLRDRLPASNQTKILAMGASEFKNYNPLPNVPAELSAIVQQSSNKSGGFAGSKFLNQSFSFRALRDNLPGHKILHIATHGKFAPGRPEDSFLVLGTSEKLTIPEIKTLQDLSTVHLVVLSACETALGGADQDGVEISGLSSYFLSNGAKSVMASLWSVDDASTSLLMYEFYRALAASTPQKPVTKAQALRQAQLALIREGRTYARPYYWAPFVLIGNGL
jgi:CHAT domain-containing protein/Tfp pilus assembly protein PilF